MDLTLSERFINYLWDISTPIDKNNATLPEAIRKERVETADLSSFVMDVRDEDTTTVVEISTLDNPHEVDDRVSSILAEEYSLRLNYQDGNNTESIIHDIACSCVTVGTDVKQSETFMMKLKPHMNLTPDFSETRLTPDGREALIVEFGTSRSSLEETRRVAYHSKYMKYFNNIKEIQEYSETNKKGIMPARLVIIIISDTEVMSNVDLPNEMVDEFCNLYNLGNSFRPQLVSLNLIEAVSIDDAFVVSKVNSAIKKIESYNYEFKDNLLINDANIAIYSSDEIDEKNAMKGLREVYADIMPELDNTIATEIKRSEDAHGNVRYETDLTERRINDFVLAREKLESEFNARETRDDMKAIIHIPYIKLQSMINDSFKDQLERYKDLLINANPDDELAYSYKELFSNCISLLMDQEHVLKPKTIEEKIDEINEKGGISVKSASERKRESVFYEPSIDDQRAFAKDGVEAKKFRKEEFIRENLKNKSRGFHLNTDTSDIERFLAAPLITSERFTAMRESKYEVEDLIEESILTVKGCGDLNEYEKASLERQRSAKEFDLFKFCETASSVAMEAATNMIKNLKESHWLVGRISETNIFYVIKTTSKKSHIFMSLIFEKRNIMVDESTFGIFKQPIELSEDLFVCPFFSLQNGKFQNWVTSYDRMVSLLEYMAADGMNPLSEEYNLSPYVYKSLKFCFLVNFEDKRKTEDVLIRSRYVYQKAHETLPRVPDTSVFVKDIPVHMTSRLCVFVSNKLLDLMEKINSGYLMQSHVERAEDGRTVMNFDNLHDFITGERFDDYGYLLDIFYRGYMKNKDQEFEKNTKFNLVEKMIEEDKDVPYEKSESLGKSGNLCKHDFNVDIVKLCGFAMSNQLKASMGSDYKELLGSKIIDVLSSTGTFNTLSTLKASSGFDATNCDTGKYVKNKKVLFAGKRIYKDNSDNTLLIEAAASNFCRPDYDKRMFITIFPKNQHGGTREISIMTVEDRMFQRILEIMSEVICKNIKWEITCNPGNEGSVFPEHTNRIAKQRKNTNFTAIGNSNDAKRWNQIVLLPKFGIILCKLLPKKFHKLIWIVLERFENKKIQLPEEVFKFLNEHITTPVYNKTLDELRAAYHGMESPMSRLINPRDNFITIKTGMLQGLLQVTSSLFHCSAIKGFFNYNNNTLEEMIVSNYIQDQSLYNKLTESAKRFIDKEKQFYRKVGKKLVKFPNLKSKFMKEKKDTFLGTYTESAAYMVTSDDSVILNIYQANTHEETKMPILLNSIGQIRLKKFLFIVGAILSEKSTTGTVNQSEFKSEFNCQDQAYCPRIKNLLAAFNINVTEDFVSKQQQNYNIIRSVYETGVSSLVCFALNCSLARMFYRTLGSDNNDLFPVLSNALMNLKMATAGFYYVAPAILTGIVDFSYCDYWITKNLDRVFLVKENYKSLIDKKTAELDKEIKSGVLSAREIEIALRRSLKPSAQNNMISINFSNISRAKKLIDELEVTREDMDYYNHFPQEYYMMPTNEKSLNAAIARKVLDPNLVNVLGKTTDTTRELSKSIYVISSYCVNFNTSEELKIQLNDMTMRGQSLAEEGKSRITSTGKISLLALNRLINKYIVDKQRAKEERIRDDWNDLVKDDEQTDEDLKTIFPETSDYELIRKMELKYSKEKLLKQHVIPKRKKLRVRIDESSDLDMNLVQKVLIAKWFGIKNIFHRTVIETVMSSARKIFPWISDTFKQSLAKSLFENAIDFLMYLETLPTRHSYIRLKSSPISPNVSESTVETMIRKLCFPRFEFINKMNAGTIESYEIARDNNLTDFRGTISGIALSPLKEGAKVVLIEKCFKKLLEDSDLDENILRLSSRRTANNVLKMIMKSLKDEDYPFSQVFVSDLEKVKNGAYGIYTTPQTQDKKTKKYTGYGVWEGVVMGIKTKLEIDTDLRANVDGKLSTHLKAITIATEIKDLSLYLSRLATLCQEMDIDNSKANPKFENKNNLPVITYLHNFKLSLKSGCPILLDREMIQKVSFDKREYELKVESIVRNGKATIRLIVKNNVVVVKKDYRNKPKRVVRDMNYTVLSFSTKLDEFQALRKNFLPNTNSLMTDWLTKRPASVEKLVNFLSSIKNDHTSVTDTIDQNEAIAVFRKFADSKFKNSNLRKYLYKVDSNIRTTNLKTVSDDTETDDYTFDEDDDDDGVDFDFILDADNINEVLAQFSEVETMNLDTEFNESYDEFIEFNNFLNTDDLENMFSQNEKTNIESHPIIDDLIRKVTHSRGENDALKKFLRDEEINAYYRQTIEAISMLLPDENLKFRKVKVSSIGNKDDWLN